MSRTIAQAASLLLAFAATLMVLPGCSDSAPSLPRTPEDITPRGTFQVVFRYEAGTHGGTEGVLVWRQSGDRRRWDIAWGDRLESYEAVGTLGTRCSGSANAAGASVDLHCQEQTGAALIGQAITLAEDQLERRPQTARWRRDKTREIPGVDANCFDFLILTRPSEACLDPATGALLLFSGYDVAGNHHIAEATSISASIEGFEDLSDLELVWGSGIVTFAELHLPSAIVDAFLDPPEQVPYAPEAKVG